MSESLPIGKNPTKQGVSTVLRRTEFFRELVDPIGNLRYAQLQDFRKLFALVLESRDIPT